MPDVWTAMQSNSSLKICINEDRTENLLKFDDFLK